VLEAIKIITFLISIHYRYHTSSFKNKMVATTPRYRTQSDPDGVIHVSDDDLDFNEPGYGFSKGIAEVEEGVKVVDVTHMVDPPDVREMHYHSDRRDPPTDPGALIYDLKSVQSEGQLSEIAEEGPSSKEIRRDPSLRSNHSVTKPIGSVIDVKSSSSLGRTDSFVATPPIRSYASERQQQQVQEVMSVESAGEEIRDRAGSPIVPSVSLSKAKIKRDSWCIDQPDHRMEAAKARTASAEMRAECPPQEATVDQDNQALNDDSPIDADIQEPNADSIDILPGNVEGNGESFNREQKEGDSDTDESGWVFSSILNTLTCRGPDTANSSSGPLGLVTCGASTDKPGQAFAHDDEEVNSVLGPKGFGDLASLPSLEDSILHKAGDTDNDNESLSSRYSRASMQTEYLGNAVESKIKNMEIEKQQRVEDERYDKGDAEDGITLDDPEVRRLSTELNEALKSFGQHHVRCANISSELSAKYTENKFFKKALELQKEVVSIYRTKLGDHHQDTLEAKIRLGKCLEDSEEYDDGISFFYQVMAMRRSLKGEKDPSTSDALIQIANCLRKKGQYMQAIRELKRALKVYRESLGDSHPSVASTVDEIASLYVTLGDFDKSAAILEEVVKLKAATLGMQHKQVASSLVELATSYECSEDFERAVKALKKAYKIYTDLDGFSCEEATSTLHRIALIYQASGDIHKAAIAYLGVLRGKKHLLGDDHLEVAETYYRLGVCLRETNQLDKALKCMKEALPILVGKGKNIHDVDMIAEVMHEMALLYKAKRQLTEAAKIFKQELTVRRKIGQPDYPCIAKTLNHLGVTEYEMKMHRRALKHLLEVLTIFQERQEQGIDFAEALYNIGLVFEAVRNKERAYEAFLEAARVFKANGYANDHPHMVKAVNKVKRLASSK